MACVRLVPVQYRAILAVNGRHQSGETSFRAQARRGRPPEATLVATGCRLMYIPDHLTTTTTDLAARTPDIRTSSEGGGGNQGHWRDLM